MERERERERERETEREREIIKNFGLTRVFNVNKSIPDPKI